MKKVIFSIVVLLAGAFFSTSQAWATPKLASPEVAQGVVNQVPMTPTPMPPVPCLPTNPECPITPPPTCDPSMNNCSPTSTPTATPTSYCKPTHAGCVFPTPFPTPTYSPDEVGAIAGLVTDKVSGLPLAGIQVCAKPAYWYPMPDDKATLTPIPTPVAPRGRQSDQMPPIDWGNCADTQTDGRYEITSLLPFDYAVTFFDVNNNYIYQNYNPDNNSWGYTAVTVVAKETQGDINLALAKGGHITGQVVDSQNQPVVGIQVVANRYQADGHLEWVGNASTDDNGHYDIGQLASDSYIVSFSDWASGQFTSVYYDNVTEPKLAKAVKVNAGETTMNINAKLSYGAAITGRVTNAAGEPLAGVFVMVHYQRFGYWEGFKETTTNAKGEYKLAALGLGSYAVGFQQYPQDNQPAIYLGQYYDNAATLEEATAIKISKADQMVTNINAVLEVGGSITGRVTNSDEKPVESDTYIIVAAYQKEGENWVWRNYAQVDSQTGIYTVTNLPKGIYRVGSSGSWGSFYFETFYENATKLEQATDITVMAGATTPNINMTIKDPNGHITGKVTDINGQPVTNIYVEVSQWQEWGWGGVSKAMTQADGQYDVAHLSTGTYRLGFYDWSGQYMAIYYKNATDVASATDVQVTTGQTASGIDVVMSTGGTISGHVTNSKGEPLMKVEVCALAIEPTDPMPTPVVKPRQMMPTPTPTPGGDMPYPGYSNCSYTAEDGGYTVGRLTQGEYVVKFFSYEHGYLFEYYDNATSWDAATPLKVVLGQPITNINATLSDGGHITGQVTDMAGKAIAGISIEVYRQRGEGPGVAGSTFTDAQGNYDVTGLDTGSYLLRFWDGQKRYAYEFYNDVAELTQASAVTVKVGEITSNINAQLGGAMPPVANVNAPNSEVSYDTRGLATISQPSSQKSDVTVEMAATGCSGRASNVTLHMNSLTYPMSLATNGMYQATIPASQLIHGATLTVTMDCNGSATENRVGQFLFSDQAVPEPGTDNGIKKVYLPLLVK